MPYRTLRLQSRYPNAPPCLATGLCISLMVSVAVVGHVGGSSNPTCRPSITHEASRGAAGSGFAVSSSPTAFTTNRRYTLMSACGKMHKAWEGIHTTKWCKKGYGKGDLGQEGEGVLHRKGSGKGFPGYFLGRTGGGFLYRKGSRKGSWDTSRARRGGVSRTEKVGLALHIHHIQTPQRGMSTILLLPQLLLTLPCSQVVLQIVVAPPVDRLRT